MSGLWRPCRSEPEAVQDCQRSLAQLLLPVSGSTPLSLPVRYRPGTISSSGKYKTSFLLESFHFGGAQGAKGYAQEGHVSKHQVKVEEPHMGQVQLEVGGLGWEETFPGCPSTLTL